MAKTSISERIYIKWIKTKIKKTTFSNSTLLQVDFSETDLTSAVFENCNMEQAVFNKTILEKTDFRTAYNYSIDPENNRMKKSRFSSMGLQGLLYKYDIVIDS